MDGVPGLSQAAVEPGQAFTYEFTATNPGTRLYHSHADTDTRMQLGLFGAFIIDPLEPEAVRCVREFTSILTEKALDLTPAAARGEAELAKVRGQRPRRRTPVRSVPDERTQRRSD